MKTKSKSVLSLVASCTMLCSLSGAYGADPLYQWNFNGSNGANTGTGTGGILAANVGPAATTPPKDWVSGNFNATGVSGAVGDKAYGGSNTFADYWGNFYSDAATANTVELTGLTQFTITMWINRSGGNVPDILNIGSTTTPDSTSSPGISIGVDWNNQMRVGVNGVNGWSGDLWSAGSNNGQWVFMAVTYTATESDWWSPAFGDIYFGGADQPGNAAVLTGDISTSVTVAQGFHLGGAANAPGSVALGSSATAFLGNNGPGTAGFSGKLDDIRIYNSLLTVEEIEAVRLSAFDEPTPAVNLYWKGAEDANWTTSNNWTSDLAGTVPGGPLATDGSQGIAFSATDPLNLTNVLAADQSVKNIVCTLGSGAVSIGDTSGYDLTIGSDGIWLELTAGGLAINSSGDVILGADQIWKNKSPNALTVSSVISGAGKLTKDGLGPLQLGGDNSTRTGGTVVELGTVTLGHANALGGASASLAMNGGTLDLNGNSVTLGALSGDGDGTIHNSSATACTLTLDMDAAGAYGCHINDGPGAVPVSVVKKGSATVTSGGGGNFSGPMTIEDGHFVAIASNWGVPNSTSLGNAQLSGRTVTVTSPGLLTLSWPNILGNQGDTSLLPEIIVNGTTMKADSYNRIGPVTLNDGSILTQQATLDNPAYQGIQFTGEIKVIATNGVPSSITATSTTGNHLAANTVFNVADVTLDSDVDLTVSAPLLDQSGDFASAAGGLTKEGIGTMLLSGTNTYTGDTTVVAGILAVDGDSIVDTNKLVIDGGKVDPTGGTEVVGTLFFGATQKAAGTWGSTASIATHKDDAHFTGTGVVSVTTGPPVGYATWATTNGTAGTPSEDHDNDGVDNGFEYFTGGPTGNTTGFTANPAPDGTKTVTWTNGASLPVGDYGTQYVVQKSTDLATWTPVPNDGSDTNLVVTAGSVSYTINGAGKQFVRLVVTPN